MGKTSWRTFKMNNYENNQRISNARASQYLI